MKEPLRGLDSDDRLDDLLEEEDLERYRESGDDFHPPVLFGPHSPLDMKGEYRFAAGAAVETDHAIAIHSDVGDDASVGPIDAVTSVGAADNLFSRKGYYLPRDDFLDQAHGFPLGVPDASLHVPYVYYKLKI